MAIWDASMACPIQNVLVECLSTRTFRTAFPKPRSASISPSSGHIYWHPKGTVCLILLLLLLLSVGLPVANAPDVLQPCGLLYYPWCSNSHSQSSPQEILAVRVGAKPYYFLDVPTFTTSRLRSQRWNYVGEKFLMNFAWNARLPRSIQESFTCRKSTT